MNCFVFIFVITLAVATANPVEDLSYEEIMDNCNSLKEENKNLREANNNLHGIYGKYNIIHEKYYQILNDNIKHQRIKNKLKEKLRDTKTTLEDATNNNKALQSSNEQLETELQEAKTTLEEATKNNNALQSSNEQLETELQNTKNDFKTSQQELQSTKTTLEEATKNYKALQSSNDQCKTELQETKTTLEEATTNNEALQSSYEQLETELQDTKNSPSYEIWLTENKGAAAETRAECQRDGGDLATWEVFGFGPEGDRYFSEIENLMNRGANHWAWVGMNDIVTEGKYQWTDGSPYEPELDVPQYAKWYAISGYPKNSIDDTHPQGMDCIIVGRSEYGFADYWCDDEYFFGLCQRTVSKC